MLKNVRKSKILLSLIAVLLMVVLFGNVYALATEEGSNNPVTITATTDNTNTSANQTNNTTNTTTNISTNTSSDITTVSAGSNNTTNNTSNNTSTYNNSNSTSNSSSLPYTGTSSKTMLLVAVFAISAVYAYKKVTDYNV